MFPSTRKTVKEGHSSKVDFHEGYFRATVLYVQHEPQALDRGCYNTDFYKDFRKEARVYKKRLQELQGTVVPVCFGYYLAVDDLYGPYSVLLLEYCGESLTVLFEDLRVEHK